MAGLLPATVADGMLCLTCQREYSFSFDDWLVLISHHNQDFIRSTWQIFMQGCHVGGRDAVCYPDSSETLQNMMWFCVLVSFFI